MKVKSLPAVVGLVLVPLCAGAYPLDGYEDTGIRRLEYDRLANAGEIHGRKQPPGALLSTEEVDLRLMDRPDLEIPPPDPAFTATVRQLLGGDEDGYAIAVLDLTNPDDPRYAEIRGDYRQNVGSVGKLVVALAVFQAMADIWPDEEDRLRLLRNRVITADEFAHRDHHTVTFYDVEARSRERRPIRDGDQASLWEYLDWMLSPSSNSAAGMVMREAMLMRQYGEAYPPSDAEAAAFFNNTPKRELTELYRRTFHGPLERNGFDLEQFRQGSFFTARGKAKVPGTGTSYATVRSLLRYGLLMEKGQLVDEFSSRQLKRLLYVTERRIRYASSPRLKDAAVYFKSGSLYSCREEEGFQCGAYRGNVRNYMNSFAIVESPAGEDRIYYLVMLISNVLRKNSAVEHQTLGTRIQELMEAAHPEAPPADAAR
ncbi:MAG: serine hydrolase [Anaerolineae bacterium]